MFSRSIQLVSRIGSRTVARVSVSCLLLLVTSSAHAAAQSSRWIRAHDDSLVTRAIARRGVQLADSTLLSFEANARGFLTFLAQLGEGFLIPPRVVQSEELASRLYWWQPGRSVQRLVGRRDTTLLPASVGYYRDRYQVVLDNLPDLIRLGDGQDVRDVPHPLSQSAANSVYEYARGGVVSIRIPGREILVDEVRFRPTDDRAAAAVGTLYLDRETAAVVRLSMSFTRPAILDRRIETLVLSLDNALIAGRYWLPRRQEVEVARRATWFEIPARGIVRGWWEITGYSVNEAVPVPVRELPRWSSAPRDSLRAYPFTDRIVDVLPPEIEMASDDELTAARKQVEEAVRAAALARPARAAVTGRNISDFARYTRTEGLAVGAGLARRFGGVQLAARARFGIGDEQLKGQVALSRIPGLGGAPLLQVFAERDYRDIALPERAGVTNSAAALLFSSDYTTQVDTRAAGVSLRPSPTSSFTFRIAYEQDRALAVVAGESRNAVEPVIGMWDLDGVRAELRTVGGWVPGGRHNFRATWNVAMSVGAHRVTSVSQPDVTPRAARLHGFFQQHRSFGNDRALVLHTQGTIVEGRDMAPQQLGYAGGPWSAPGYEFHEFAAQRIVSQRIEWRQPVPAPSLSLGKYGNTPARALLAPYAQFTAVHGARSVTRWRERPVELDERGAVVRNELQLRHAGMTSPARVDGIYPSVGLGVLFFYDLVRADVARGLRDGVWRFSIDIDRSFWGIL